MKPAVHIENLSKWYRVGLRQEARYRTIREAIARAAAIPGRRLRELTRSQGTDGASDRGGHWALKDVALEVQPGEVIGIIGRNGAGKSTLLKVLSRITEPTSGRVELRGKVASLLEVGTGFHPELTGRENIYLNGAILGMSRSEIARKFDEIVAFAEIDQYLDTPVKRYSSGMYVRLAFAVASQLDSDILVIDEVLAVGDMAFQRKCLGRIGEIGRTGRTVLFVSHNMAAIDGLCTQGAVMDSGRLAFAGNQGDAIRHYMELMEKKIARGKYQADGIALDRQGNPRVAQIREAKVTSGGEYSAVGYPIGALLEFRVVCTTTRRLDAPKLVIGIDNEVRQRIVTLNSQFDAGSGSLETANGEFEFVCRIDGIALRPGDYHVELALQYEGNRLHQVDDALIFTILPNDIYGTGGRYGRGMILCHQVWEARNL